jgi:hypothetical protein
MPFICNIAGKISYALSMLLRLAYMIILGRLGFVLDFVAQGWFGRRISDPGGGRFGCAGAKTVL